MVVHAQRALMVGLAYFLTARLGLAFVVQPEGIAGVWPASGLMLAILLSTPRRTWAASITGMVTANITANLISGTSLPISLGFALANALEPLVAASMLKRFWTTPLTFTYLRDVIGLVFIAAGLSNALTALIGAAVSSLGFGAPFFNVWRVWWIADGLGMLIVAPVILTWGHARRYLIPLLTFPRVLELCSVYALLTLITHLVFGQPFIIEGLPRTFPYQIFPPLLWIAIRFGPSATAYGLMLMTAIAVWDTVNRGGLLSISLQTPSFHIVETQLFVAVAVISSLVLASVIEERKAAERSLRESETRYRDLVGRYAQALEGAMRYEEERRARLAAEEADKLKLKFLAMISHELRTPLTPIKGFITTLLADDIEFDAATQRKFLAIANEEADRLQELIGQLLDLSQIQAGKLRINPQSSSVNEILEAAHPRLQALTDKHTLVVLTEGELPPVHADQTRVIQVLSNLVQNAVKYAPPQTLITISVRKQEAFVRFDVHDQGKGIPPELREAVFEAFRQLQGAKKGIGLGLAICKGLIESHGGRIWVDEGTTMGTMMSFTLPVSAMKGSG